MRYDINGDLLKTYQTFSNFVEMATQLSSKASLGDGMSDQKSSIDDLDSFFGDATSFDDMVKRCYDGYNAKSIASKRVEIGNLIAVETRRDSLAYVGEALDVPTYLSGEMRCFWAEDSDYSSPKRIHITYSANCVGSVSATQFYNHGGAVAVICDALDNLGAQTKITCTFTNVSVFKNKALQVIEVKDYNESIDIPRIGATTHPSFFRRIGFRYFERLAGHLGKDELIGGECYGCSKTGSRRGEVVSDDEFSDWLRIDEDEIVIDLPAADNSVFDDTNRTAKWVTEALEKINNSQTKHIRVYG